MKKTNHLICLILTLILLIGTVVPVSASSPEQSDVLSGVSVIPTGDGDTADDAPGTFMYQHDPTKSPAAMKDIVRDESAIYGFRPNESGSLKQYAEADWSDPEIVAQGREERIAYHNSIESMYETLSQMLEEGKSAEEIARTLSKMRNDIRIAAYENDPEGLERMKERNLEKYGHEEGPLPDELYEQYGSWEKVTEKAFSVNVGMDVCLGLYDDYYFFYVALGIVEDDTQLSVERILGDADGNGTVTVVDATCIQRYLAGSAAGAFHEAAADADEDTTITIIDATYIQRWLADLPSNSRIGQTMPQHADA